MSVCRRSRQGVAQLSDIDVDLLPDRGHRHLMRDWHPCFDLPGHRQCCARDYRLGSGEYRSLLPLSAAAPLHQVKTPMAKARALDKRRKSIMNIRKITRTMELIATARFKKAMDRASAATAYTKRITALVADLANTGLEVSHPLLEGRSEIKHAALLVLTGNRGLCGGNNSMIQRAGLARYKELQSEVPKVTLEVSGKRGISAFRFRDI